MKDKFSKGLSLFVDSTPRILVNKLCGESTPIFYLHRLSNPDEELQTQYLKHLEWCLEYVRKKRYNPITLYQLTKSKQNGEPVPDKSVVFTFDDGFIDQYELAGPLFSKFDIPFTCFVITDFLDKKLWPWDDQISYLVKNTPLSHLELELSSKKTITLNMKDEKRKKISIDNIREMIKSNPQGQLYPWLKSAFQQFELDRPSEIPKEFLPMSWANAQSLIDSGHDVSPHTATHRILSQLSEEESKVEIEKSLFKVKSELNGFRPLFAYPTGRRQDFTEREATILEGAGIMSAVTTIPSHYRPSVGIYKMPRYSLPKNRFDFIQYLSFLEHLKRKIKKY